MSILMPMVTRGISNQGFPDLVFSMWGAGGGGGLSVTYNVVLGSVAQLGCAGGSGAFLEIKVSNAHPDMQFEMVRGGAGGTFNADTRGASTYLYTISAGGGAASMLIATYNGVSKLVAIAGAGGGGPGGARFLSTEAALPGQGGVGVGLTPLDPYASELMDIATGYSATDTAVGKPGHDIYNDNILSAFSTATYYSSQKITAYSGKAQETYGSDGGDGSYDNNSTATSLFPAIPGHSSQYGYTLGGSLPTPSYGGEGGPGGLGFSYEGGGAGGGGGYFGGGGGMSSIKTSRRGAGGGGGSSAVLKDGGLIRNTGASNAAVLTVGGHPITVELLQTATGSRATSYENVTTAAQTITQANYETYGIRHAGQTAVTTHFGTTTTYGAGGQGMSQFSADRTTGPSNNAGQPYRSGEAAEPGAILYGPANGTPTSLTTYGTTTVTASAMAA